MPAAFQSRGNNSSHRMRGRDNRPRGRFGPDRVIIPCVSDDDAIRALRSHREGVLACDGVIAAVRFVLDNATGRVVFPSSQLVFEAEERVLFVPQEADDALQLLLTPGPADPDRDEACDRWKAYHGTPDHPRWASCAIESGRLEGAVVDGEVLMTPNALAPVEPGICKRLNADRALLTRLAARFAGVEIPEPLCVGVDPGGLDIRARFGIVRVPFSAETPTPDRAAAEIDRLVRGAQA